MSRQAPEPGDAQERRPPKTEAESRWWWLPLTTIFAVQIALAVLAMNKGAGIVPHSVAAVACLIPLLTAPIWLPLIMSQGTSSSERVAGLRLRPAVNWERALREIVETDLEEDPDGLLSFAESTEESTEGALSLEKSTAIITPALEDPAASGDA